MRAVVLDRYGSADDLRAAEIDTPHPENDQILVRVRATALNSWDWEIVSGAFPARVGGLFKPPHPILGADIAGVIEAVGPSVTRFRPGDAVIGELTGHGWGGLAEFVCAPEAAFVAKPEALGFEDAAALPQAGELALQALAARPDLGAGHRVLIVGGSGGVGSFAIQMAKAAGAHVTGVDNAGKLELMRSLGADVVADFRQTPLADCGGPFDLVVDPVARHSLGTYLRLAGRGGVVRIVGGRVGPLLQCGLIGPLLSKRTGRDVGLVMWNSNAGDLEDLARRCEAGALRPVIGGVFPLAETVEAFRQSSRGEIHGKAVIIMPEAGS